MLTNETPIGSFDEWLRRRVLELTTELEQGLCVLSNEEKVAEEEFEGRSIVCGVNGVEFDRLESGKSFIEF